MGGLEHSDEWLKRVEQPSIANQTPESGTTHHDRDMKVTREKPGDWLSSRHTAFHSEGDHAHESFQGDFGEPHATPGHGAYPHDFSAEEALFAEELRDVFALDYDEPPAFYARALLDDEQRAPLPLGSEQKATYQVLRRLKLPRRPLFDASGYAEQRVRRAAQQRRLLRASRSPFAGVLTLLAAFLIGAVILTAPAFAAGLQLLAGHTGVQQTQSFPAGVHSMTSNAPQQLMSLLSVTTPISWLGPDAQGFVFDSIGLFGQTVWSNGPIVDVQYRNPHVLDGLETLDIREFQISSKYSAVLQVVQQG
ncbi:MAG TPA: hypothetical protein VKQ36_15845, partial [Ktedonobacterales bacterium]|nr:hypothetical protein [Ktedonobacterales bacterium]